MGVRVIRVSGFGLRISDFGCGVQGVGFRVIRVSGFGLGFEGVRRACIQGS